MIFEKFELYLQGGGAFGICFTMVLSTIMLLGFGSCIYALKRHIDESYRRLNLLFTMIEAHEQSTSNRTAIAALVRERERGRWSAPLKEVK